MHQIVYVPPGCPFTSDYQSVSQSGLPWGAQWIRMCLPVWGTQVLSLVQEDATRGGTPKPLQDNY